MVWEVKHTRLVPKDEDGLPGEPLHLIIARNVLDPREVKFFVSNAPPETPVATLLLVAFSRWRVERCFATVRQVARLTRLPCVSSYPASDSTALPMTWGSTRCPTAGLPIPISPSG